MDQILQKTISVFIVEDHDLVRRMLGKLIRRNPELTLCGESPSAEEALLEIPDCQPQLVLVDVSLPGLNGIELIRILHEKYPQMWVLAISGHDESVYAKPALQAGARGYVMKGKIENVEEAIRQVRDGEIYVSEAMQTRLNR
jgi:DNA-binding NarL/FixJ family response regulator